MENSHSNGQGAQQQLSASPNTSQSNTSQTDNVDEMSCAQNNPLKGYKSPTTIGSRNVYCMPDPIKLLDQEIAIKKQELQELEKKRLMWKQQTQELVDLAKTLRE